MKNHWLLTLALLGMLSACGKEPGSTAAGEEVAADSKALPVGQPKNIVEATSDKVDAAVAAGTKALDAAIEEAEGERPAP